MQINTFGGVGYDDYLLNPGEVRHWISFGGAFGDFGRVFSFAAVPILRNPDGNMGVEVTDVAYEMGTDGIHRVSFNVRNVSDTVAADYRIFYTYTDIIYY